jgi:hypothetical protein
MARVNVGHIVNHFDPAGAVLRSVRELNLYSRHKHTLAVREPHPLQHVYQYEQPRTCDAEKLIASADVLVYHFVGHERGWTSRPHSGTSTSTGTATATGSGPTGSTTHSPTIATSW